MSICKRLGIITPEHKWINIVPKYKITFKCNFKNLRIVLVAHELNHIHDVV